MSAAATPAGKRRRPVLLYVYGSGRCRSTMLDRLLNAHPRMIGLGEVSTLNRGFDPLSPPPEYALPGESGDRYRQFWRQVGACYERRTGQPLGSIDLGYPRWLPLLATWDAERARAWGRVLADLLASVEAVTGPRVFVLPNKLHHVLHILLLSDLFDIRVVHLVRDARAVACSYARRYANFAGGMRIWMVTAGLAPWFRHRVGRSLWLVVRYEDLVAQPARTLERVARLAGLDFDPAMLDPQRAPYFGIGGSPGAFRGTTGRLHVDTRWRDEIGFLRQFLFGICCGWLNRLYGYPMLLRR